VNIKEYVYAKIAVFLAIKVIFAWWGTVRNYKRI
jgi:hypothetical protein